MLTRAKIESWLEYIKDVLELYRRGNQHELSPRERAFAAPLQLAALTAREIARDGVVQQAGALTFFSVLSMVPLLSVVTALLGAYGVFEPTSGNLAKYLVVMFPSSGIEIVTYLQEFSTRGASSFGGVNGVVLLVISIFLFNWIERALTRIWNGPGDRSLIAKFLMFYTMISLGPLLLILSVVQTASAQLYISSKFGIDTHFINWLLPFAYAWVVFTLMNKTLPNVYVKWESALLGGALTAAGFEGAKWGFNQYVNIILADSYNQLYGALGVVPIFLLWVYVTWVVVLVGSEIAYCFQHSERLLRLDSPIEDLLLGGAHGRRTIYDALACVDVLTPIVSAFHAGEGPIAESKIAMVAGYDARIVREITERMVKAQLLVETQRGRGTARKLMPARPLEDIMLGEVMELFHRGETVIPSEGLERVRREHHERLLELFDGMSALSLADVKVATSLHELEEEREDELDE